VDSEEEPNCLQDKCNLGEEINQVQLVSVKTSLWKTAMLPCKLELHIMITYNSNRIVTITTIQNYKHVSQQ